MGRVLPVWSQGELDIHAIATYKGECWLYILPDGTTMAVDCGELSPKKDSAVSHDPYTKREVVRRLVPGSEQKASETAAEYMHFFLPAAAADSLDYMLLTHHHNDHMNGIPGLYDLMPFRVLLDRTDTSNIAKDAQKNKNVALYWNFIRSKAVYPHPFELGVSRQVFPRHGKPDWTLLGLSSSGKVMTEEGLVDAYEGEKLSENGASISFLLSYGKFDWLASGDAGDPNSKVLWPVAQTVGRKIEAMKVPHHYAWRTFSARLIELLQPQVMISESFWSHQPWKAEMEYLWNARYDAGRPKDLFLTSPYLAEVEDNHLDAVDLARFAAYGGHIVLRVAKGGSSFNVYLLDENKKVITIYGPYRCQ
ncbi:MAG: hypothetical protein IJU13_04325 [Bacteroidales bacterium]|nr:hypothetical protein [Bacteroidales bacterium]